MPVGRSDAFVGNDPDLGELVDIDAAELLFLTGGDCPGQHNVQ